MRLAALLGIVGVSILIVFILSRTDFFRTLELRTLDYRFRILGAQGTASSRIAVVKIDDFALQNMEPVFGRWPWPREVHGYFIRFMQRADARLVAYDVLFTEREQTETGLSESDRSLVEATREAGNVIHSINLSNQPDAPPPPEAFLKAHSIRANPHFREFVGIDFPFDPLAEASYGLGHVATALDPDGPLRRYLPLANFRDRSLPSLAMAAVLGSRGLKPSDVQVGEQQIRIEDLVIPLDEDWRLPIWFNGGPGTYSDYGYYQIIYSELQLQAGESPNIDPEEFRDKMILVGVTAAGLHDLFTTPFSGGAGDVQDAEVLLGKMSGVEVHANVLDNLLQERFLRKVPGWISVALFLLFAIVIAGVTLYTRLWMAATASFFLLGLYLVMAQWFFASRWQLPVASIILLWSIALGLTLAYQYWFEDAEKRKVKQIFSRYVSRDIYRKLLEDPTATTLGGQKRTMTVLFSDLRGFTSMSENRPPEEIVSLLNEYFSDMVEIVFRNQGTIDKFVGDMIMALFGAPLEDPEHARHAVTCAVEMHQRLEELNAEWKEKGLPELAHGIGINSGEMIAGNVGARAIQSYTVIGDNVNLGARLESLCTKYEAGIIISEFTRAHLDSSFQLKELGQVVVKGRTQPVEIFEVQF